MPSLCAVSVHLINISPPLPFCPGAVPLLEIIHFSSYISPLLIFQLIFCYNIQIFPSCAVPTFQKYLYMFHRAIFPWPSPYLISRTPTYILGELYILSVSLFVSITTMPFSLRKFIPMHFLYLLCPLYLIH